MNDNDEKQSAYAEYRREYRRAALAAGLLPEERR